MAINTWVKDARQRKGWTQAQLADAVGVTKANVSGWENKRHRPSIDQVVRISLLTGMPMPGTNEAPRPQETKGATTMKIRNIDAELGAAQVALLALFNSHPDPNALLATLDAIVLGIRTHAADSGASTDDAFEAALKRFRDQLVQKLRV